MRRLQRTWSPSCRLGYMDIQSLRWLRSSLHQNPTAAKWPSPSPGPSRRPRRAATSRSTSSEPSHPLGSCLIHTAISFWCCMVLASDAAWCLHLMLARFPRHTQDPACVWLWRWLSCWLESSHRLLGHEQCLVLKRRQHLTWLADKACVVISSR